MKTNIEELRNLFAQLVEQNEERREQIKAMDQDLIGIDQELKEKEDQLIPLIGEEATKTALKTLKAEKIKELNDRELPQGSHKELIEMRAELTSLIQLVEEEISRSTQKKKGTVKGNRIRGSRGTSWINHYQIETRDHPDPENTRDTNVKCPVCDEWLSNEASARRHIENQHPGVFEKLVLGEDIYF